MSSLNPISNFMLKWPALSRAPPVWSVDRWISGRSQTDLWPRGLWPSSTNRYSLMGPCELPCSPDTTLTQTATWKWDSHVSITRCLLDKQSKPHDPPEGSIHVKQEGSSSNSLDVTGWQGKLSTVHVVQEQLQTPSRSVSERHLCSSGLLQTTRKHGLDTKRSQKHCQDVWPWSSSVQHKCSVWSFFF